MGSFKLLLLTLVLIVFNSCQKNTYLTGNMEELDADEKSLLLIEADNVFGMELFQNIRKLSNEENLMISPLSVSVALAMAYNGSDNETRAEMETVMKLNGLSKEQINNSYKKLISELQLLDEKVVFEIANAIYYAENFQVKNDFISVNQEVYKAEVHGVDFTSPSAVEKINNWVNEKTHGKIEKILERLNPLDRMVLLNAIYFYGTWSKEFNENGTHKHEFIKKDGTPLMVPMMNKLEDLPYASNEIFKAIKMPYGDGRFNMVIMLPQNEKSTRDVIENLTAANWKEWMVNLEMTNRVDITMPRFKFAFEASLNEVLSAMGMKDAFNPNSADFSLISDEDLYISEVRHKTYIDVNETGTEAAAVTSITFSTTSMGSEPPTIPFLVNKPFIFAITENTTGAILFFGEVQHPEYD
jgi:serine protease inhibitor